MTAFQPCNKCDNGYTVIEVDEFGDQTVGECQCHRVWRETELLKIKVKNAGLSSSVINYSIEQYKGSRLSKETIDKLKQYVEGFNTSFYSIHLYFWSYQNSTQKTTIASWIGKELLQKQKSVYFILMNDLLRLLVKTDFEEEALSIVNKYESCDFLIIDEAFDPRKVTVYKSGYQIPFLDSFLRKRMSYLTRATCFTSNIPISEIGTTFDTHLQKLMERSVIDPMEFRDEINISILRDELIKELWK